MRNSETGEFELVVGNRQLLSGFAIVVLLFGVGVAMGYILGQNSPRSAKLQPDTTAPAPVSSEARPQPASPAVPPTQPVSAPAPASGTAAAPVGGAAASETQPPPAQAATQPARESNAAAAPAASQSQPVVAAASPIPEAPPGNYWQVMALPQPDAEVVMRTLKEQGLPALLSPGTKGLTRVLVGPFSDTQAMGKAKTLLESNGFHPRKNKID